MPFLLFRALEGVGEQLQSILAVPTCMRDELATRVLAEHDSAVKLRTPAAQALLEAMALLADIDVAAIESAHSQLRELTMQRARGHVPRLTEIAARNLIRWSARHHSNPPRPDAAEDDQPKATKHTRATSAWNAFQALRCAGQKLTGEAVRRAKADYDRLSPDELEALKEEALRLAEPVPVALAVPRPQQSSVGMLQQQSLVSALPGHTYLDRLKRFFAQVVSEARERRKQRKQAANSLVDPVQDVREADQQLARSLRQRGGDGLLDGLGCVPASSGCQHVDQVFWRMPLTSFAQACLSGESLANVAAW